MDDFLSECKGAVHVGANTGQERDAYAALNLNVLWVEPLPDIFDKLTRRLAGYPQQKAVRALVADIDGKEYTLHISSNAGLSSSILPFGGHTDIWPKIKYVGDVTITGTTLASLLRDEPDAYDALVLDTQGTELLVLRGAGTALDRFRYIKTEAADFEVYKGCCRLSELTEFLACRGFTEQCRAVSAERAGGGKCYDVVYKRKTLNEQTSDMRGRV